MSVLVTLLIIVAVVLFCGWLFLTYVYPRIPAPWNWIILVIGVIIIIVAILDRFVL